MRLVLLLRCWDDSSTAVIGLEEEVVVVMVIPIMVVGGIFAADAFRLFDGRI